VNPNSAVIAVDNSKGGSPGDGAVYKGLAMGTTEDGSFLYAANFRNGSVDMFNSKFDLVRSFTDPTVPIGYAPFNVQVLDGKLFVTFAKQDASPHDDVAGAGHGFVDEFSLNGSMIRRVASHGALNSPWGLAIAPAGFGEFSGDLLVGNLGDGTINVFNPTTDQFLGKLDTSNGTPFHETDLWALMANGHNILFTAGPRKRIPRPVRRAVADRAGAVDGERDRDAVQLALGHGRRALRRMNEAASGLGPLTSIRDGRDYVLRRDRTDRAASARRFEPASSH
jgi:uncharacterized protein (TIGR03118 family)